MLNNLWNGVSGAITSVRSSVGGTELVPGTPLISWAQGVSWACLTSSVMWSCLQGVPAVAESKYRQLPCVEGDCSPRLPFGYNPTQWRRFPGTPPESTPSADSAKLNGVEQAIPPLLIDEDKSAQGYKAPPANESDFELPSVLNGENGNGGTGATREPDNDRQRRLEGILDEGTDGAGRNAGPRTNPLLPQRPETPNRSFQPPGGSRPRSQFPGTSPELREPSPSPTFSPPPVNQFNSNAQEPLPGIDDPSSYRLATANEEIPFSHSVGSTDERHGVAQRQTSQRLRMIDLPPSSAESLAAKPDAALETEMPELHPPLLAGEDAGLSQPAGESHNAPASLAEALPPANATTVSVSSRSPSNTTAQTSANKATTAAQKGSGVPRKLSHLKRASATKGSNPLRNSKTQPVVPAATWSDPGTESNAPAEHSASPTIEDGLVTHVSGHASLTEEASQVKFRAKTPASEGAVSKKSVKKPSGNPLRS